MRGIAKFNLGGTEHNCSVPLSVVEAIENETDRGAIKLMREVLSQEARLTHVVAIIQITINSSSVTRKYSREDVAALISKDGILAGYIAAGRILSALFEAPEEAKRKTGKATVTETPSP